MTATVIAAAPERVVEQVGSYAGFAAIVGLGVLALLYFTQAREVKRLREWAGRAPERAAELEERVQADAQKRVVAQPIAPTSAAGQQAAEVRAQAATAAVYASVGAQAPGAPPPPGQLARAATPAAPAPGAVPPVPGAATSPAPGAATAPRTAPAPAPAASAAAQAPSPTGRAMVTATPVPAPAAIPSATSPAATAAARVAAASRTIAAPANGSTSQETTESAAARPEPLPAPPAPPPGLISDDDAGERRFGVSRARVGMIVGGALAAIAVAVVLVVVLTGSDENPPPENNFGSTPSLEGSPSGAGAPNGGSRSGSSSSSSLTSAERRATDVAVLNGTTQTGLARAVANRIQEDGFTIGGVATNANQSVPTTIVSYTGDHRKAALAVAKIIGIDSGSVQAADANAAAAASGDVLVTVGSDQIE